MMDALPHGLSGAQRAMRFLTFSLLIRRGGVPSGAAAGIIVTNSLLASE